jgi:putative membrane-bound dehydrogenase-like protein
MKMTKYFPLAGKVVLLNLFIFMVCSWAQPIDNLGGGCPEFQYEPAPQPWPYNWRPNVQRPLTPEQSIKCLQTPDGLKAELWASEDMFDGSMKVWTITFDEQGRAWLCETLDYPNVLYDPVFNGQGHDRIRILEDTDGDRIADKSTVFVDGLNQPKSLVFTTDGIVVAVSPHFILFKDENGDDVADSKNGEILYTGIRSPKVRTGGDTHGQANNFIYGLDNWIYGNVGYNGGNINGINFGSGGFRFRQDGSEFQWYADNTNGGNSDGMGMMEDGQTFSSHATGGGHIHHQVYQGMRRIDISDHGHQAHAITDDWNAWDFIGSFTCTSGPFMYTARYLPEEYWNVGLICEPEMHFCHTDFFQRNRSSWTASAKQGEFNFVASTDAWTAPMQAKTGPDGAMWVVDWNNYLMLHNPQNPMGPGGAFISSMRDNTMSRIYRIVRDDDTPLDDVLDLSSATPSELVAVLASTNMLWRQHAQRLLLKQGFDIEAMTLLEELLDRRVVDEAGFDGAVTHAVWVLNGYGIFDSQPDYWVPKLKDLLVHPSYAVRMNVLQAMPRVSASAEAIRDQCSLNDPDPHVRLKAMQAVADMPEISGLEMYRDYVELDAHSRAVFDRTSGVNQTNTLTCEAAIEDPVEVRGGSSGTAPVSFLKLGLENSGALKVVTAVGLSSGTIRIYEPDGRLVAQQKFDGKELTGEPLMLERKLYLYTLTGEGGRNCSGKIAVYR